MTLCLSECLRAVGLQHHYARFTSMGVKHVAHLSALTLEDYPNLGIKTMKDRTRLFHLIQMVKTLDLENIGFEDCDDYDDYGADGGDVGNTIVDTSFTYDGYGDPDEGAYDDEDRKGGATNKLNAATFARTSCVRRRLDFSCEESDHHQKLLSHPLGSLHVHASPNRNDGPVQGNWSATPLQLELDNGSAVVCVCRRNNSQRTDAHSCPSNPHKEGNTKPDIIGGAAMYNTHTKSSPKFLSFHKQKSRSATMASKRFSTKPVGYIDRKRISKKEKLSTEIGSDEAFGRTVKPTPIYESKRTTGYNYGLPQSSPPVPNRKKDGEQRISVCVRKRPLTQTESRKGEADVVTTSVGECVIVHESKEAVDLKQYILQHRFYFDQVFGEESSNEEVYQRTAHPLVQHMLNGGKATCFAYGQTGAGKTHTMLGSSPRRPGLYALAVRDIFAHLSTTCMHSPLLVYVSFFEIYCGQLYDLLDHRKRLFAREDGHKVVHIAGLRDVRVDSVSSLLEVISQGTEERTQGMSGVNPLSSRSHALLQIQLRGQNQQIAGRMWFVDLAGSERASDSKEPDKQSRMEGAEINQSLLALKECIRSLDQEQSHTPFRQSKLTQVLRDSFVGDSMTCMIANISPGHLATEHTLNTLRYADRVKELRGQGTPRGGRRGKTLNSPKHNQFSNKSSSGSSIGTRGKSPPKRQKLGRQRDVDGPTTSNTKLTTGDPIFCSKPKNRRWRVETGARGSKGTGLELITPVSDWLGIGDERHRWEEAGERKGRRRENERYGKTNSHSVSDQNTRKGLVLGHPKDEQLNLWEVQNSLTQRVSGICLREKENQQSTMKGERDKERRLIQQRRQLENSRDACREGERLRERELQKAAERDKERQRHLRHYHQQLQQFIPSSASLLSSNQTSLSSSVSPSLCSSLRHSFHPQASASMCHGLEEVLDMYRVGIDVRADCNRGQLPFSSGEIYSQSETSLCCKYSNNEDAPGDSGGVGEVWKVSWEGTESRFGQDRERRSVESTGGARVRREDRRPAGIEGGERRWAWVPPTETDQADWMAGAMPGNVVSYSCHSEDRQQAGEEGLDSSDVPADGVRSAEEKGGAVSCGLLSTHSNNDSNSLFNRPPFESPHQRAPAERPLSPASEHINTLLSPNKLSDPSLGAKHTRCFSHSLPLPLQNTHFSSVLSPTLPLPTSITQTGYKKPVDPLNKLSENSACTQVHNHLEVKAEISALPQDEINSDSLSHIMDPFSISLLQVDPQVSTASFLQEEQNDTSLCLLNNERGEDKRRKAEHHSHAAVAGKAVEDEDIELHLSFLDLPHCPPISDTKTAVSHTERGKETSVATYEHCGIGRTKPPMSEVMLVSLEDQENSQTPQTMPVHGNKAPATPLKASTCSSVQTSIVQSISPSIWLPRNTDSPSSHNLIANAATQMPTEHSHMFNKCAFSISIPQSESVLGQYDTVHSNDSSNSNNSLQQDSPEESNSQESTSNQQTRPIIHLSTPEDLDHAQWCIVQSHWEQLEEMEVLWHKEGTLLCQQPDMAFGDYVHKLEEIMERKALCIRSMRAQLRPYLKPVHSNQPHKQEDNNNPIT